MNIQIKRVRPDAILPQYATNGSAGADLYSTETFRVEKGNRCLVPTGIAINLPEGYEAQIRPRSGWAYKSGLTVLNTPGTIDSDYVGEVKVLLINHGSAPVSIRPGDRIAQLVIAPVIRATWQEVESLDETVRASGGFGSSGR